MSRFNGKSRPWPFQRGMPINVPIVGQCEAAPPAGKYFYSVPVLVQRAGHGLEAEAYECQFPMPLTGVHFMQIGKSVRDDLKKRYPDEPAPKVVPLTPFFLGFIPQAELDRQADAEKTAAAGASPTGEPS